MVVARKLVGGLLCAPSGLPSAADALLQSTLYRPVCRSIGVDRQEQRACFCRYHAKRALYLAHIASALKGQPGVDRITLSTLCNDPRWVIAAARWTMLGAPHPAP